MNGQRQVLVVDDDDDIREIVGMVLLDQGIDAIGARDGLDALDMLRDGVRPSLILLDLMMPRLDGAELVRALRATPALAGIPVVILSGDTDARRTAASLGVAHCLTKPVDLDELLDAVDRFAARR